MIADAAHLDVLSLQSLFIDKNKAFTEALREKKPHKELVVLFSELKEYYRLLHQLKSSEV